MEKDHIDYKTQSKFSDFSCCCCCKKITLIPKKSMAKTNEIPFFLEFLIKHL